MIHAIRVLYSCSVLDAWEWGSSRARAFFSIFQQDQDDQALELRSNAVCGANKQKSHCHMVSLDFACRSTLLMTQTETTHTMSSSKTTACSPRRSFNLRSYLQSHIGFPLRYGCICVCVVNCCILYTCARARNKDDELVDEYHRLENSLLQLLQKKELVYYFRRQIIYLTLYV